LLPISRLQHRCADYRDIANAILADQSVADHGEAAQGQQPTWLLPRADRLVLTLLIAVASLASNFWRSHTCRGGGTKARDRVEDRRLAARAQYIRLRPWVFRPGTGLLPLRYIAGGGERYTN